MEKISDTEITLIKTSSKTHTVVGETIVFTISVTNLSDGLVGNVEQYPIIISDILPPELSFVKGSVYINNVNYPELGIIEGITLSALSAFESRSISFSVEVVSYKDVPIKNSAMAIYGYMDDNLNTKTKIAFSNECCLYIDIAQIGICKKSHSDFVVIKDTISYSITLYNSGTVNAMNVVFIDTLPNEVQLIDSTFSVDGSLINAVDISKGINIGNIPVGEKRLLKYNVKVLNPTSSLQIKNDAKTRFIYILDDMTTGYMESAISLEGENTVNLGITNFKQLNIQEYLNISSEKPDIDSLNIVNCKVEIVKSHVIKTNKTSSCEGQHLSGHKLIVHGLINEIIEYTACEENQRVHSTYYKIPFSTFIVLPDNYKIGSKIEVDGSVEDVVYNYIDCRTIFTNVNVLINAKILFC